MKSRALLSIAALVAPALLLACSSTEVSRPATTTGSGGAGQGGAGDAGYTDFVSATTGSGGSGGEVGAGGAGEWGAPMEAPAEEWTWVPFDDAFCGDGSKTGIGINLTDKSKKVVIYMEGGGACWDNLTCFVLHTASNLESGYDEARFMEEASGFLSTSLFDRNNAGNPFKDYSFVFVPYCTGDIHAGGRTADYNGKQVMHVGGSDYDSFLKRIVPTFEGAERIILSGSSAGGFGAGFNWGRTQAAFGATRVDLVDDCGPPLPAPYMKEALEQSWRTAWGLDARLPADCPECLESFDALFGYYGPKFPNSRAALLSHMNDETISAFFQITQAQVAEGLDALAAARFDTSTNFRYFFTPGSTHCTLQDATTLSQNGIGLMDWLSLMINDDPAWDSVHP